MKHFDHTVKRVDKNTGEEIFKPRPAVRVTRGAFNSPCKRDRRPLVVTLEAGDVITVRLLRSPKDSARSITANDLLWHLYRTQAQDQRDRDRKQNDKKQLTLKGEQP